MAEPVVAERPLCADASIAAREPMAATASRVEHWILVEYSGYWPYDPLDATVFAGGLRSHLAAQLARLPRSRLLLVRRPGRARREHVRLVYGSSRERGSRFHALTLDRHPELLGLDLAGALLGERPPVGDPLEHPLLLVCTHGKRDRCCARYGQALCANVHERAPDGWVWQASHVGGDRFAGNLVCLPEGLYFGRVGRPEVERLLARYLEGAIALDCYRGRSCYSFAVQAAERAVRERAGLTGFHDVSVRSVERVDGETTRVTVLAEVSGDVHEVEVALELSEEAYLTCRSPEPKRARHFVARAQRVLEPAPEPVRA
jgi:hypothetical protein